MEATYVSIDGWMDLDTVHIYHGKLSVIKRSLGSWVICRDMDGPRVCHTELNQNKTNIVY